MGLEDRVERLLKKLKLNRFAPFPFARSGFLQTVYGYYWPHLKPPRATGLHTISLGDGDSLVAVENRPQNWRPGKRIVVLVHGLTGSHRSAYMERMARRLYFSGHMVLRLNLRGCGPGFGLSHNPYHCGVSDDTRQVVNWISQKFPSSPITQVGFSLGGNVTLKMAGEDGSRPTGNLDSVVAVSPPADLKAAARMMGQRQNKIFEKFFIKHLVKDVRKLHKHFPELGPWKFPEQMTIETFDEVYTAPRCGFESADDYYKKCSAVQYIPEIQIPTMILCSIDDPVIDGRILTEAPQGKNVDTLLTEHGGHVGFLGWGTRWDEIRWSDQAVASWLDNTVA